MLLKINDLSHGTIAKRIALVVNNVHETMICLRILDTEYKLTLTLYVDIVSSVVFYNNICFPLKSCYFIL